MYSLDQRSLTHTGRLIHKNTQHKNLPKEFALCVGQFNVVGGQMVKYVCERV